MLMIISPAKTLDFATTHLRVRGTVPAFLPAAATLVRHLRERSAADLSSLMRISPALGELNAARFAEWHVPFTTRNARPAVFAFRGDVYAGLDAYSLDGRSLQWAQRHLRILSGLYGLLRPLDLIQAYRLEMGTRLEIDGHRNLYGYWSDRLTDALNAQLSGRRRPVLLNLASAEYFGALDTSRIAARVVTPAFREHYDGGYRFLSFFGKRARGAMARYVIEQRIRSPAALRHYEGGGYRYSASLSTADEWVFVRDRVD